MILILVQFVVDVNKMIISKKNPDVSFITKHKFVFGLWNYYYLIYNCTLLITNVLINLMCHLCFLIYLKSLYYLFIKWVNLFKILSFDMYANWHNDLLYFTLYLHAHRKYVLRNKLIFSIIQQNAHFCE